MNTKPGVILLISLLFSAIFTLTSQPILAENEPQAQTNDERDALLAAWSLPNLVYEGTLQAGEQCVRAAFAMNQYSSSLTGTLTYAAAGDVTYQTAPSDRLRVIYANGLTVDFRIGHIQGYFEGGADGFLNSDYQVRCRATVARQADLTVDATRRGSDVSFTTAGTLVSGGNSYQVDTQGTSNVYFESSFGGSEYRLRTELQGDISGGGLDLAVNDQFFFHIVTLDNESASVNHRTTQSQWRVGANRYRIEDGFLNRSFKDGLPSRLDTEWRAGGTIWRGSRRWGTIDSRVVNDVFDIQALLPDATLPLESIPLTAEAAARAPELPTDDRRFSNASPLDPNEEVRMQQAIYLYQQIGLSEEAAREMIAALGTGDDTMIALTITAARLFVLDNDYDNVLELLQGTLAVVEDAEGEYAAALYNEVGKVRYYLGDTDQAFADFQRALDYYQEVGNREQQAVVLAHLGLIYEAQSDYEAALAAYLQAIDLQERVREQAAGATTPTLGESLVLFRLPTSLGTLYSNLGSLYHTLGEEAKAEAAYLNALEIRRDAVDRGGMAAVLHNLGRLYSDLGRYEEALPRLQEALEIARTLRNVLAQGHILRSLGEVYQGQATYELALQRYNEALNRFAQAGDDASRGSVLNNMGLVYFALAQYEQAEPYFQEALEIFEASGYRTDQATVLSNRGNVQERLGNRAQALSDYRAAIDLMESIQGELHVEEVKSAFLSDQSNLYAYLVDFLWQEEEELEALAYAERARARTFLEQLANPRVDLQRHADVALVEQAETARHEIVRLQNALSADRAKAIDQQDPTRLAQMQQALETTRKAYAQLLLRLKLSSPEYATLMQVETLAADAIQEEIPNADTALLAYFVLEERTLAWIIDRESIVHVQLAVGRNDLRNQIDFFRDTIKAQDVDESLAAGLHRSLFAPLEPFIHQSNLIIVPHDVLHYLPFAALQNAAGKRYLVEDYAITYAPSASVLPFLRVKHSANEGRLLALGNPDHTLPHTAREVSVVAQLYNSVPLTGTLATESFVHEQAGAIDILHLAAHGVYETFDPLFTRIELAADDRHDGNLEVNEVYGLDLTGTNLIVLSACETALGEQSNGDEIISLTRAFLYAGSPSVITSLWNVNDESTAYLMARFYTHMRVSNITITEALRQAQVDALIEYPEPFHWAAFTLHGSGG